MGDHATQWGVSFKVGNKVYVPIWFYYRENAERIYDRATANGYQAAIIKPNNMLACHEE